MRGYWHQHIYITTERCQRFCHLWLRSCHYDNLRCHQWRQSWHHDNSFIWLPLIASKRATRHALHLLTWWRHQMETFSALMAFVRRIHRSPVNFLHKGQWCGALMFSLICAWIHGWVNNREAGDLRHHRAHYDVTVMIQYAHSHVWCDPTMACLVII